MHWGKILPARGSIFLPCHSMSKYLVDLTHAFPFSLTSSFSWIPWISFSYPSIPSSISFLPKSNTHVYSSLSISVFFLHCNPTTHPDTTHIGSGVVGSVSGGSGSSYFPVWMYISLTSALVVLFVLGLTVFLRRTRSKQGIQCKDSCTFTHFLMELSTLSWHIPEKSTTFAIATHT